MDMFGLKRDVLADGSTPASMNGDRRATSSGKKGSAEMMEYMFMTLFVIVIVIAFVLFLAWWQTSQAGFEKSKMELGKTLMVAKSITSSPFLIREDAMFDDGKLTSALTLADFCQRTAELYGAEWFANITVLDGKPLVRCSAANYPDCNNWDFCRKATGEYRAYALPVNVYRVMDSVMSTGVLGRTYVASLEVGVYV